MAQNTTWTNGARNRPDMCLLSLTQKTEIKSHLEFSSGHASPWECLGDSEDCVRGLVSLLTQLMPAR